MWESQRASGEQVENGRSGLHGPGGSEKFRFGKLYLYILDKFVFAQ